jgi:hypothetical protein
MKGGNGARMALMMRGVAVAGGAGGARFVAGRRCGEPAPVCLLVVLFLDRCCAPSVYILVMCVILAMLTLRLTC